MGEEHITEPGPDEMPYGMRDTGFSDEMDEEEELEVIEEPEEFEQRRAVPIFPSQGMPGGEGMDEEEHMGGARSPDSGEVIQGGAQTDTGQRRPIYPGGAAGSDFDFDAEPATDDIGGELGGDMDPDEEDWP